jgi:hypothetical protein
MSAALSERVAKLVGCPPLSEMDDRQRREFHEALLDVDCFEDLPGKWQAAILGAEQNRPGGLDNAALQESFLGLAFAINQSGLGPFVYRMAPPDEL